MCASTSSLVTSEALGLAASRDCRSTSAYGSLERLETPGGSLLWENGRLHALQGLQITTSGAGGAFISLVSKYLMFFFLFFSFATTKQCLIPKSHVNTHTENSTFFYVILRTTTFFFILSRSIYRNLQAFNNFETANSENFKISTPWGTLEANSNTF